MSETQVAVFVIAEIDIADRGRDSDRHREQGAG